MEIKIGDFFLKDGLLVHLIPHEIPSEEVDSVSEEVDVSVYDSEGAYFGGFDGSFERQFRFKNLNPTPTEQDAIGEIFTIITNGSWRNYAVNTDHPTVVKMFEARRLEEEKAARIVAHERAKREAFQAALKNPLVLEVFNALRSALNESEKAAAHARGLLYDLYLVDNNAF
jgi:hypothetical protein